MTEGPTITVTEHGPYLVTGELEVRDTEGSVLRTSGTCYLCRCGGSRSKPFCDATHWLKGFDGTESASHDTSAERREDYPTAAGSVVHDDRTRCAHFGQCTDRLPEVFHGEGEPFVRPGDVAEDRIDSVVRGCPSGALTLSRQGSAEVVEEQVAPSVTPIVDGPYRVRGGVQVVGADGRPYEVRERQTLCRCGQSRNKPFCDGSHWYAGFRDPVPAEMVARTPTLYEWIGGIEPLEALTTRFYADLLAEPDPILEPIFRGMDPEHPRHVAAWLAETFGGPREYTRAHGGYEHMVAKHRGLGLTEEQRQAWVTRMVRTADEVGLCEDWNFRATFLAYLEWGTRFAVHNSQPDADVLEHAPVPHWGWGSAAPFVPQPWDDPTAAERGRERYAREAGLEPPGLPEADESRAE